MKYAEQGVVRDQLTVERGVYSRYLMNLRRKKDTRAFILELLTFMVE